MKKIVKILMLPLVLVLAYSCASDDDGRFSSDPEYGWIQFDSNETTVAVTTRTTSASIPISFTAPINKKNIVVNYNIVNISGDPANVITGLSSSVTMEANTNKTSIDLGVLPTALANLIANGDVVFDIQLTGNSAGVAIGLDENSNTVHKVKIICAGEPPIGTYVVNMHDSYGDGWQTDNANGGSGMTVVLTDISGAQNTIEFGMCTNYSAGAGTFLGGSNCTGPASATFFDASINIEVGPTIVGATWNFPGDRYGEISFEIIKPNGETLYAAGTNHPAGELPVSYCQ